VRIAESRPCLRPKEPDTLYTSAALLDRHGAALFDRQTQVARQRAGPLLEERLRYLGHLADQGLARRSLQAAAHYTLFVADDLRLANRPGETIPLAEVEQHAVLWADKPPLIGQRRRSRVLFLQQAIAWLGHVSLTTTNIYAEVDLEMKAKALATCEGQEQEEKKPWREDEGLMAFLRSL
jgi:hypothetical protein